MKLSDTYSKKVDACVSAISSLGYAVHEIIKNYNGKCFPNGLKKSFCFQEVINKDLSEGVYNYLEEACGLVHHRDARRSYEYGIDLILGWLIEDAIMLLLKEKGKKAILSGEDRYREFLSPRKISTQPDIKVICNSGERMLEIFSDWKGTWRDKNHADLRDNKFNKLKEHKALMIGIAPLTDEGFVMDFAKDENAECFVENFIPTYKKMGYTYNGICSKLKPLNEAIEELLSF